MTQLQEEITKKLTTLYEELQNEYISLIEQCMIQIKINSLPIDQWMVLKHDLTDNNKTKLQDFKDQFSRIILQFLQRLNEQTYGNHPLHNIHQMQHTGDLLSKSFFNQDHESIKRRPILVDLVNAVNQKIKVFFYQKKQELEEILKKRQIVVNELSKSTTKILTPKIDKLETQAAQIELESTLSVKNHHDQEQFEPQKKKIDIIPDYSKCLCAQLLKAAVHPQKVIECQMCHLYFHQHCIKASRCDPSSYICPYCTILNQDLFSPVTDILCTPIFFQLEQPIPQKHFQFKTKDSFKGSSIQFRCLRVDENHGLDEITWPDYGEVLVNGAKLFEFKPLNQNTSLKKRKDSVLILREKLNSGLANYVTLKETRPSVQELLRQRVSSGQTYLAGIFGVGSLNPEKLVKQIKKDTNLWYSIRQSKEMIRLRQSELQADGLEVPKVKISVACPFTTQRIQTPARGHLCQHVQCFSLESMIQLTFNSTHRKWRCPICRRKCFKMLIDGYQLKLIEQMKKQRVQDNNLIFLDNGEVDSKILKCSNISDDLTSALNLDTSDKVVKKIKLTKPILIDG